MPTLLDIIFPRSCTICSKHGEYLCDRCKRLFKKTVPECYICRRISGGYTTHSKCMKEYSLDSVVVLWEYNKLTSTLLKKYKYGLAIDIENVLNELVKGRLEEIASFKPKDRSLCIPVPVSLTRLRERGFNQTEDIARGISNFLGTRFSKDVVYRRDGSDVHQSLLDKGERVGHKIDFYINNYDLLKDTDEVIVVDDVITTGSTIEQISKVIKSIKKDIKIRGVCLFRGKPYYKKEEAETSS
ncbi:MAG TPA: hypothetical protein VJY47_02365 [Candidatus Dojkabacteria bacterium]|nr:hypothetical protein [Candidatus Dojkabacteria bacterium]